MEQKFNNNRLDLQILREFCEQEGEEIAYRKGDQLEYHAKILLFLKMEA